ncbi:sensor histidine kinase [Povalibacter sp.]|uniref:sensor histidine kinase n=1 Tax=Povalibacter sp. TaxID=1962978 RepID=UPI002F4079FD
MADSVANTAERNLEERVLVEQVALMSRLTTSPLFGSIIVGAMLLWLTMSEHGWWLSGGWYALLMFVTLLRWRVARDYLAKDRSASETRRWRTLMLVLAAVAGGVWSMSGTVLLPQDPLREIIVAVFFAGVASAGIGSQAPVRYAYAALLIPFILPYAINQMLMGGDRIVLGLAYLSYIPVMLVISNRQTKSIEQQIRLAFENEALIGELRRERDRATRVNGELQRQVEEQRRATQRIRSLNRHLQTQTAELLSANKDLEGFSYSVSHDLRAPLRAIDGFSSLLRDELASPGAGKAHHYLGRIRDNILRMSTLIDDLLEFARCGRETLERSELDMNAIVAEAAGHARTAYDATAALRIVIHSLPRARGDARLMQQVWQNLLDNAVKYTSRIERPLIEVTGREEKERVVFEVRDNGIGFDSRYSEALFGVFQRLHDAHEYPGSGVGLAIVQRIVTRHGGEVWAQSQAGQGACFGFWLPLQHEHNASDPNVPVPELQRP